ncbi:hypothetical protein RND71_006975 [Anisodus tanguticus]|uniref:Uncharacterized protein n=1 Tax=Anisodus tanguticus TaxID=243964 RepID=A0AAE1VMV1_9SOLA|nr:hypothetical protein RND71_006975 [Anisodus tanguticus]
MSPRKLLLAKCIKLSPSAENVFEFVDMDKEKVSVSPDTVLEDFFRTAVSESDSSKASTSELEVAKKNREFFKMGWIFRAI